MVITRARGIGVTDLLQRVGATSVPRIGRVPSADVRRKLLRQHREGRCAPSVVEMKTYTVSRNVAVAQVAALVIITHAQGTRIVDLIRGLGATTARKIGSVPSADVRRTILRNHQKGLSASIVLRVKTWPSILSLNVLV